MAFWKSARQMGLVATTLAIVGGCASIYTSPSVGDGSVFGDSGTDLKVNIVGLSFESTTKANLSPYVPARLPLGFQPEAVQRIVAKQISVPSAGPFPQTTARPSVRPGFVPDNLPPIEPPSPYTIGVADVLLLSANAGSATLDQLPALISAQSKRQGFVVQDDGAIAIPDAGRVRVAGLTMQDAEAVIFQALVSAGIDPSFTFEISEFNSQRVSVSGEIRQPALVPITLKPLYLHEAISSAGGVEVIDPRVAKVQLFRGGQTYQVSMQRFQSDPAIRQIILQDGDSIYVTSAFNEERANTLFQEQLAIRAQRINEINSQINARSAEQSALQNEVTKLELERDVFRERLELGAVKRDYAYLTGEAVTQRRMELPFEQKAVLADVLFGERGLNINFSDYGEIYVLRRPVNPEEAGSVIAYHLDATNAVNLTLAQMFEIHAGDVVFVAEQPVTAWNRALTQTLPSLLLSAANVATGI
ncbi:MAG: polysaccharide biosynthesis/export family protein [Pseudomonadota bacterium]